jgi:hypothetical protein
VVKRFYASVAGVYASVAGVAVGVAVIAAVNGVSPAGALGVSSGSAA